MDQILTFFSGGFGIFWRCELKLVPVCGFDFFISTQAKSYRHCPLSVSSYLQSFCKLTLVWMVSSMDSDIPSKRQIIQFSHQTVSIPPLYPLDSPRACNCFAKILFFPSVIQTCNSSAESVPHQEFLIWKMGLSQLPRLIQGFVL